ncbi:hypothetical protein KI387_028869 [Taxus chinensis]|uniref:Uncharacterized protein n=1 Tax=Taxus chinensis TaxID=29808 RepID=A0AA38CH96_TAXCH|nr:hypothetical protein KI387_028869 [Taxus chinensis]
MHNCLEKANISLSELVRELVFSFSSLNGIVNLVTWFRKPTLSCSSAWKNLQASSDSIFFFPNHSFFSIKMDANRDECPLIVGAQGSPFAHRMFLCCFCCFNVSDECPSWSDKLQGSARRGRECSGSLVNQAAAICGPKWRNVFKRLKRSNSMAMYSGTQTKSRRFQYDPLSYALNFDDGSVDEDEHSLRAFSARFARPIAMPREKE